MSDVVALLRSGVGAFNEWRLANPTEEVLLREADLRGLDLRGAFFMGAKLDRADLSHANLQGAVFAGASLRGARLDNCDASNASFGPPAMYDATLAMSPLGDPLCYGANLEGASFVDATLSGASFLECEIGGADFTNANHGEADFRRANVEDAVMPEAGSTLEDRTWGRLRQLPLAQRQSYLASLWVIACADGEVSEAERAWLQQIVAHLALTQEEALAALPTGAMRLEDLRIEAPTQPADRIQWLRNLAFIAAADGELSRQEFQVCLHLGQQLGFAAELVGEILFSALAMVQALSGEAEPAGEAPPRRSRRRKRRPRG